MWQIFGVHDYSADLWAALLRPLFSTPRWIPSHSPVLVSSADMLHATNRTLQIKQTCTNNISLLLRTLNIFAIIVFLEGVAVSVSCCSMLRTSAGGHFLRPWAEETATSLASSHGTQPGCDPHFKPSSAQMESSKAEGFPPFLSRMLRWCRSAARDWWMDNDKAVKFRYMSPNQFSGAPEFGFCKRTCVGWVPIATCILSRGKRGGKSAAIAIIYPWQPVVSVFSIKCVSVQSQMWNRSAAPFCKPHAPAPVKWKQSVFIKVNC